MNTYFKYLDHFFDVFFLESLRLMYRSGTETIGGNEYEGNEISAGPVYVTEDGILRNSWAVTTDQSYDFDEPVEDCSTSALCPLNTPIPCLLNKDCSANECPLLPQWWEEATFFDEYGCYARQGADYKTDPARDEAVVEAITGRKQCCLPELPNQFPTEEYYPYNSYGDTKKEIPCSLLPYCSDDVWSEDPFHTTMPDGMDYTYFYLDNDGRISNLDPSDIVVEDGSDFVPDLRRKKSAMCDPDIWPPRPRNGPRLDFFISGYRSLTEEDLPFPIQWGGTGSNTIDGLKQTMQIGTIGFKDYVSDDDWSVKALGLNHGGTGGTTAEEARQNLVLGRLARFDTIDDSNWNGRALGLLNGGTGSREQETARRNLGLGLSSVEGIDYEIEFNQQISGIQVTVDALGALAFEDTIRPALWSGETLPLVDGGVDASNAMDARYNLLLGQMALYDYIGDNNWMGPPLSVANGGTGSTSVEEIGDTLELGDLAYLDYATDFVWGGDL